MPDVLKPVPGGRAWHRSILPIILSLHFALAFIGPAQSADPPPVEQGTGLCRFILHGYQLLPQTEATINAEVGKSMKLHQELFGFRPSPAFAIRMRIFGKYGDYEAHTARLSERFDASLKSRNVQELTGYYFHPVGEIVTWRQKRPDYMANNILHEASHAIMMAHYRRMPMWLSEGCATYFSYPSHMQDDHDIGTLRFRWAKLNLWYRQKKLPALHDFVDLRGAEWARQDMLMAYSVSWSIFQYLMSTPEHRQLLRDYMNQLQERRGRRMSAGDLLNQMHPGGLDALEKNWHTWIYTGGKRVLGEEMEDLIKRVQ